MARRVGLITMAVAVLFAGAPPAGAAAIACGTTITASTTLTADMTCLGDAIAIGAPGVVLDLGGHTLRGPGSSFIANHRGVDVQAAQVTVRNGRIEGFRYGVILDVGSDGSKVERLSLHRNGDGVQVESSSNRIAHNSVTFGTSVAVLISGSGNVVEANSLQQNAAGVFMKGIGNRILANDIAGENGDDRGILAINGGTIVGNRVSHYGGAAGIDMFNGGEVSGNQVFATVDGIRVRGAASVAGNVVFGNADDGIDAGAGAVLRGNIAIQNADLGIDAGAGTIDAGGNRAFANANPLQCVGVACS